MDDEKSLTDLNEQFIEAVRQGSWEQLAPILSAAFTFLNGTTGELVPVDRYREMIDGSPVPDLVIDQLVVQVDGDCAVVSARTCTSARPARYSRYLDVYERRPAGWVCVHACLWPVP